MDNGKELWVIWQSLLESYAPLFGRGPSGACVFQVQGCKEPWFTISTA